MTALPAEVSRRLSEVEEAHVKSAYKVCLVLESSLQSEVDEGKNIGRSMIYIRILGYLIHYVPKGGLKSVVYEITSAKDRTSLLHVGKHYYDHYLRAFRSNKGPVPIPSNHASRPSFDTLADMIKDTLDKAPKNHSGAKDLALIRDGHRCVVTGLYEVETVLRVKELQEQFESHTNLNTGSTELAHIFSESTNFNIDPEISDNKRNYAASMWAVMQRFGYTALPEDLNGEKIHRLENVMTLNPIVHRAFDSLQLWFAATPQENKYKLEAVSYFIIRAYPEYVTFTTPDSAKYPLPSPDYLAIHAACARVAHLSGAAACIDKFYHDMDDGKTIDPNSASPDLIKDAFTGLKISEQGVTA